MTRQTRDIDGGAGGVFYQRVGERFSSKHKYVTVLTFSVEISTLQPYDWKHGFAK